MPLSTIPGGIDERFEETRELIESPLPYFGPAPRMDLGRLEGVTQTLASPGLRKLRFNLSKMLGRKTSNPIADAARQSRLLGSFGTGLDEVLRGARGGALSVMSGEFNAEAAERRLRFEAEMRRRERLERFTARTEEEGRGLTGTGGYRRGGGGSGLSSGFFSNAAIRARNFGLPPSSGSNQSSSLRPGLSPVRIAGDTIVQADDVERTL